MPSLWWCFSSAVAAVVGLLPLPLAASRLTIFLAFNVSLNGKSDTYPGHASVMGEVVWSTFVWLVSNVTVWTNIPLSISRVVADNNVTIKLHICIVFYFEVAALSCYNSVVGTKRWWRKSAESSAIMQMMNTCLLRLKTSRSSSAIRKVDIFVKPQLIAYLLLLFQSSTLLFTLRYDVMNSSSLSTGF